MQIPIKYLNIIEKFIIDNSFIANVFLSQQKFRIIVKSKEIGYQSTKYKIPSGVKTIPVWLSNL